MSSFGPKPEPSVFNSTTGVVAVLAWLHRRDLRRGLAVMREYESSGAYSPNASAAITRAADRLWIGQALAAADVPIPHSVIAHTTEDTQSFLHMVGEAPWVLKLLSDSHTLERIVVADTHQAALIALEGFRKLDGAIVVQRYIAEANRKDIRVLVVGSRTSGAVLRYARGSSVFPSWGLSATPVDLSLEERRIAESAAAALDLTIADVTLVRSNRGPLVLDVNPFPRLQWWGQQTSVSAACTLFDLIELHAVGR